VTQLVVLVPVLDRPHRVRPLLEAFKATTPTPHRVLFIADRDDHDEITAIQAASGEHLTYDGGYGAKINYAVRHTSEPYVFTGADDLAPQPGWFEAAVAHMRDGVGCVGTQDLCNPRTIRGEHATHFLLSREYAELPCVDGKPGPFSTAYYHNFVDVELIATAQKRDAYAFANDSVVVHEHPINGTAPDDATYRKGQIMFRQDRRMWLRRRRRWLP